MSPLKNPALLVCLFFFASVVCSAQKPELVVHTGHTGDVDFVSFSGDGRLLATGSDDGTIRLWDAATGAHLRTLNPSTGEIKAMAFSPVGQRLASGTGEDNAVRIWDATTGSLLRA